MDRDHLYLNYIQSIWNCCVTLLLSHMVCVNILVDFIDVFIVLFHGDKLPSAARLSNGLSRERTQA